jgi:hypothetical protein
VCCWQHRYEAEQRQQNHPGFTSTLFQDFRLPTPTCRSGGAGGAVAGGAGGGWWVVVVVAVV